MLNKNEALNKVASKCWNGTVRIVRRPYIKWRHSAQKTFVSASQKNFNSFTWSVAFYVCKQQQKTLIHDECTQMFTFTVQW